MLLDISTDIAKVPEVVTSEKRESITSRSPQGVPNSDSILWYPMRVTYCRELKVKDILDNLNIECFIPMQHIAKKENGKICKKYTPAIHNLIFVNSSRNTINSIKNNIEHKYPIRYIMDKANKIPITVPKKQMDDFIRVSRNIDVETIQLEYSEFLANKGDDVRIVEGLFMGVEGKVLRINKNKKVVVSIDGIAALAIAYIPSKFLQKI